MPIHADVVDLLACPVCRAKVRALPGEAGVACEGCGRVYPIEGGILRMMPEAGKTPAS